MEISLIADSISAAASPGALHLSSVIFPIDAVAPPPVKRNYIPKAPRSLVRKRCRTRRRSLTGGDDEDGGDGGFFGGDGPFGGGGGGGGGGWNFDGSDWEESSASWSDPAFDFVYEVMSWIALSNCLLYAFKKVLRIGGAGDREKAQTIC
ncbi:hypothetical protein ACET3Z_029766 [Daucus carota]